MAAGRKWFTRIAAFAAGGLLMVAPGFPSAAATADVALTAEAGLGGATKPGRWTPVRVVIRSAAGPIAGDLVVSWGATSLRRPVALPAGATQQFEFYLQTMKVGPAVSVRVFSGGQDVATTTAAVRTLRADEPFTVCLQGSSAGDAVPCTARPAATALPRSPRGYDAADAVLADTLAERALSADQRLALARWRALRALEDNGSLAATDRPRPVTAALARKNRTGPDVRLGMTLYILMLFAVGVVAAIRLAVPSPILATIALLAAAGSAGALATGRAGPNSAVIVHHATLVQQLAGASGSIVTMRGGLEYPAFDTFAVLALLSDAAFETTGGDTARTDHTLDDDGFPVAAGTFGLGARQGFTLYGVSDFHPLTIVRRGGLAEVSNTSSEDLTDCGLAGGGLAGSDGVLKAGATVTARLEDPMVGPVITCSLADTPVSFSAGRHDVRTSGPAILAAYLAPEREPRD